jgi:hypothetical protein
MMQRCLAYIFVILTAVTLFGCGDSRTGAPLGLQVHPANWLVTHPADALAAPNFTNCVSCHGADLAGSGSVVSCFSCHAFNVAPPLTIHPADWTDAYSDHRIFAAENGFGTCANCHGADLTGSIAAPSCFSASVNGLACHPAGPSVVNHPLDGSYLGGAVHGPDAEQDLTFCQSCHGQIGGPGSNPRFNIGINSVGGNGCESCHGVNYAHPPTWADNPSATFHNAAGNIANACTLCHGTALDGVGGVGVTCFLCHGASPADNPTGCLSCHGQPPNSAAPVGNVSPNRVGQHNRLGHSSFISNTPGLTCQRCHLGAGSGTTAHFDSTNPADLVFDSPVGDTLNAVFDGSNTTCTGNCHLVAGPSVLIWPHAGATWY